MRPPERPRNLSRAAGPDNSFGFSAHPKLLLWAADSAIKLLPGGAEHEERSAERLSWNLDTRSTGGWRAGTAIDLGDSVEWEKRLYYRM